MDTLWQGLHYGIRTLLKGHALHGSGSAHTGAGNRRQYGDF